MFQRVCSGAIYLQQCKTGFASHVTEMMILNLSLKSSGVFSLFLNLPLNPTARCDSGSCETGGSYLLKKIKNQQKLAKTVLHYCKQTAPWSKGRQFVRELVSMLIGALVKRPLVIVLVRIENNMVYICGPVKQNTTSNSQRKTFSQPC